MRLAGALLLVLAASRPALACSVRVTEIPQTLMRRSAIVAEGVATSDQFTFELTKFWKGRTATHVRVTGIERTGSTCDDPPTVPGARYLIAVDTADATADGTVTVLTGKASVFSTAGQWPIFDYLERPIPVSRKQLIGMLQGWQDGRIADEKMFDWLKEVVPRAQVDDWKVYEEDEGEQSLVLGILHDLRYRIFGGPWETEEELACGLRVMREEVAPSFIRLLRMRKPQPADLEMLDATEGPEDRCTPRTR